MLRSKLEGFLAARLILLFVILSAADIIFFEKRWPVFAGLVIGVLLNLIRLSSMVRLLGQFTLPKDKRSKAAGSTAWYIAQIIVTITVLVLSVMYSIWMFAGITVTEMIIPAIILFYFITDAFGITHSNLMSPENENP